ACRAAPGISACVVSSAVCGGPSSVSALLARADPLYAPDLLLHDERDPVRLARLLEAVLRVEGVPVPRAQPPHGRRWCSVPPTVFAAPFPPLHDAPRGAYS